MVAASIEIARRGYKKYTKGWFYPALKLRTPNEQWKQTLDGASSWIEAYLKFKESDLKYRFQLKESTLDAVLSRFYNKKKIKVYTFV